MKRICLFLVGTACIPISNLAAAPVASPPEIVERGPHSRRVEWTTAETLLDGRVTARKHGYTELAVGMHYKNQKDGPWLESREDIELFQGGAVFRQAQHKVVFDANAAAPQGAIDLEMPDGKRWRSTVLGIAVIDPATQRSELVAEIRSCVGELQSPNTVLYRDAFDFASGARASIRYTCTRDRFEQDVICLDQIVLPAGYGPGSKLEVWSEVFGPPEFVKSTRLAGSAQDTSMDFGSMIIGSGRALTLEDPQGLTWSAPVLKTWVHTPDGRTFLIEAVEFRAIAAQLNALPAPQGAGLKQPIPAKQMAMNAAGQRTFPPLKPAAKDVGPIKAAALPSSRSKGERAGLQHGLQAVETQPQRGLVIDYATVTTMSNVVFNGATTYYLSGNCTIGGTNNVIEGGTCIKSTQGVTLTFTGPVETRTSTFLPAVLTSWCDNTAGDPIASSTGNPWTNYAANVAIYLDSYAASRTWQLSHLRVSHATTGVEFFGGYGHELRHLQMVHCQSALQTYYADFRLRNALLCQVGTAFNMTPASTGRVEHLTANAVSVLSPNTDEDTIELFLTNSLLVAVTNTGSYNGAYNASNTDPAVVFTTVGACTAYLLDNAYRNLGTTNVEPMLLSEIKQRTTYPPIVLTGVYWSLDTTLYPRAQRDSDIPDLGFHSAPMDYVATGHWVTNATITLSGGVVVGIAPTNSTSYGICLAYGGHLVSVGTPAAPNRIVRYNTVQEQGNTNWTASSASLLVGYWNPPAATAQFRFTEFSGLAGAPDHLWMASSSVDTAGLTDCQFHGGSIYTSMPALAMTNCLLNRTKLTIDDGDGYDIGVTLLQNTFFGGDLNFWHNQDNYWTLTNNLFITNTLNASGNLNAGYNGYVTNSACQPLSAAANNVLTNIAPAFQKGALGYFYLPTGAAFIDTGSATNATNAALFGFSHYTTLTNQLIESTNRLDIGFHLPAGTNLLSVFYPLDNDADGYADYIEDWNGNFGFDSGIGEADWKTYNSKYGIGSGPGLITFTPLK